MPPHIRSGRSSDVEACVKILCDWVDESPWHGPLNKWEKLLVYWRELFENKLVWVAETNGRVVGFCVRGDDNIFALYVSAEARNKGIGKLLLDAAKADRDWITVWAYEQNPHALRFYRREGLVEVSREFEDGSNLTDIEHRWTKPGFRLP